MKLGIDVGFGFTKVMGIEQLCFPSVVGPGRELRLKGGLTDKPSVLANELDVTIDGQRWFIGSLAQRESFASAATLTKDNANNPHKRILLLTAAALMAQRDWQAVQIITGLPIADYRSQRKAFAESLKATASLRIGERVRHIEVADIAVFPQGAGALWSELLDMGGRLVDTPLAKAKIAVIDVGYRDTNFCVLDSLEYVDKDSDSAPIGIHNAHKMFADEHKELDLLVHDVGRYLDREGHEQAKKHYADLATQIIGVLSTRWNIGEFKRILLAGGGAHILKDYLRLPNLWPVADPQFANVRGFRKIANMKWRD